MSVNVSLPHKYISTPHTHTHMHWIWFSKDSSIKHLCWLFAANAYFSVDVWQQKIVNRFVLLVNSSKCDKIIREKKHNINFKNIKARTHNSSVWFCPWNRNFIHTHNNGTSSTHVQLCSLPHLFSTIHGIQIQTITAILFSHICDLHNSNEIWINQKKKKKYAFVFNTFAQNIYTTTYIMHT